MKKDLAGSLKEKLKNTKPKEVKKAIELKIKTLEKGKTILK